jgi:glycerate dehydrogenase
LSDERRRALEGITWVDHETIFQESDYLTIHTPLNEDTRHIVNARSLSLMKPTAYVINTSRGGMVDASALSAAIKNKTIAGAAIDVYEVEPPPPDLELFQLDDVILTPHIGWASEEAGWEIRQSIVNDIRAASEGQDARCVVNSVRRDGGQ